MNRYSLKKRPPSPWGLCSKQDDRSLLCDLEKKLWKTESVLEACSPWIYSIVGEDLGQSKFNASAKSLSPAQLRSLKIFLSWCCRSGEWKNLSKDWKKRREGPWSLPFAISRAYQRFLYARINSQTSEKKDSIASLSQKILFCFEEWLEELPEDLKLVYKFHLEGLSDPEIAFIIDSSAERVRSSIQEVKRSAIECQDNVVKH